MRCLARITCLDDGFDFLGFTARRYHGKLITKPSKAAIKRVKKRLAAEMRALRGGNAAMILATINPITRGWANYYRAVASSRAYASLDHYMWQLTSKRAWHRHSHKPKHWITRRYFGRYNKSRQDRWVFGDRDSGAYMPKLAWTKIVRHPLVRGRASPDDPAQASYWAERRRKHRPPLDRSTLHLLRRQNGRCPFCGDLLLHADREPQSPQDWEQWHRTTRKAITRHIVARGRDDPPDGTLSHARTLPAPGNRRTQGTSTPLHLNRPRACSSRVRRRGARTVPRGRDAAMCPAYPAALSWRISIHALEYSLTISRLAGVRREAFPVFLVGKSDRLIPRGLYFCGGG